MDDLNLRSWLVREIRDVLDRKTAVRRCCFGWTPTASGWTCCERLRQPVASTCGPTRHSTS